MSKANRPQADDKLSKLIDHFASLNQNEHLINLEIEGKGIMLNITYPPKHIITDHLEKRSKVAIDRRTCMSSPYKHILKKTFTTTRSGWMIKKLNKLCYY